MVMFTFTQERSVWTIAACLHGTDSLPLQYRLLGKSHHLCEPGFMPHPMDDNTGPVFVTGFRRSSEVNYIRRPGEKGCGF